MRLSASRGFLLLPVALLLVLVAALAFMVNRSGPVAAQLAGGEREAAAARMAAEAGLQHALWRANRNSCSGYDLASTAFGQHSYQASFTPASGSPVSVAATGNTAGGASATLRRSGVKVYDGVTTTVLQPGGSAGKDTWLYLWKPAWNYGASDYLYVTNRWADSTGHALLEFDLSGIPAGATVLSATLELYQNSAAALGGTVGVRRVTAQWDEGTGNGANGVPNWTQRTSLLPWLTPGGERAADDHGRASGTAGVQQWYRWNVTRLVGEWLSGTPNRGLMLVPVTSNTDVYFASSDATNASLRPKLTVTHYGCECGGGSTGSTVLTPGVGGEDTYIADAGSANANFGGAVTMRLSNKVNNSKRGLLRFNLAGVLPNATVTGATLALNLEGIGSVADTTVTAYALDTAWGENSATWNAPTGGSPWTTLGGDYNPAAPVATAPAYYQPGNNLQPVQWNLTALVGQWVSGARANRGLILVPATDANNVDFSTGDTVNPALPQPKLTVDYSCPCGASCVVAAVPATDYYLDQFNAACSDAAAYKGSNGTLDWSGTAWTELGDDGSPCNSQVKFVSDLGNQRLRLGQDGNGIERAVNLLGIERAVLQVDYRREGVTNAATALVVQASSDGVSWTEVGRVDGAATDTLYKKLAVDVTAHIGAATRVRLSMSSPDSQGFIFLDNVRIDQNTAVLAAPSQTFTALADTTLVSGDPITVYGAQNTVTLSDTTQYGLFRFDTSTIAAGTLISNAKLRVHVKTHGPQGGGGDSVVSVHKLPDPALRDWNEAQANWLFRKSALLWPVPGAYQGSLPLIAAASLPRSTTGVWLEFDITAMVQEWIDFPAQNIGVLARLNLARTFSVYSKDDLSNPLLQPKLVVSF